MEHIAAWQFIGYTDDNNLLPAPRQWAYAAASDVPHSWHCWFFTTTSYKSMTPCICCGSDTTRPQFNLPHSWPLHTAVNTTVQVFSDWSSAGVVNPIIYLSGHTRCSWHSRVRRRQFYWRLACLKAPALAHHSSSHTQNVLPTSCQCTAYNTACVQMTLMQSVLWPPTAQSVTFTGLHPVHADPAAVCRPVPLISCHCFPHSDCSWTLQNTVYLVRLTCQPCKNPVQPAVSTDRWNGCRQCWRRAQ